MVTDAPDALFQILQFIALALPAIVIYLQVIVSIYQTEATAEIDGRVPKAMGEGRLEDRERAPENDPNVIEARPEFVSEARSHPDFTLALVSLLTLLFAGIALILRLLIMNSALLAVGTILVSVGTAVFSVAVLLTAIGSVRVLTGPQG